jgi:ATP-dependent Lon protease
MNFSDNNDNQPIISVGHVHLDDYKSDNIVDLDALPIIPTRNLVLFPDVTIPIRLVRKTSLAIAETAQKHKMSVGIFCQINPEEENPGISDLYPYGVIADIIQVIKLPDDQHTAIVRARGKVKITGAALTMSQFQEILSVSVREVKERVPKESDMEFQVMSEQIKEGAIRLTTKNRDVPKELDMLFNLLNSPLSPAEVVNAVATHVPLSTEFKMDLLKEYRLKNRAQMLINELTRHQEMMAIAESVQQKAKESFDDQQRRMFLQRQMEAIDHELNGDDNDLEALSKRADETKLPQNVRATFDKELNKLSRLNPQSPDYSVQYAYLDTILELPWSAASELNHNFSAARKALESQHYGLEKVKERILEQIAVLINNPKGKSPILCLVGPPGVGKTSLGHSVADALGRKFGRISLGGLHDEAEIRGHRRTYIGAMPGRIMTAIRRAGTNNPVLMLDEIDKLGNDYKGDPASALLEVLDPEQNCHFHDNYIDIDFDLSNVLFIATANSLSNLDRPLIDRMEVIDLSGYLLEEKVEIARRHLLPRILKELNIDDSLYRISDAALATIIDRYTAESGVRQLEKSLTAIGRKLILMKMQNDPIPEVIEPSDLKTFIGIEKYSPDRYQGNEYAGVVTGLAWTAVGGEILFIETSLNQGKEGKLTLTGNLGDVMKESAMIALQYIKAHATALGINPEIFGKYNIHIHVPEGAIPKDGPSAGITMATSLLSAFRQCRVKERIAMTGEITLRGKVLPVGGIKEKILAAKRAGITQIILSKENKKDIEDIDEKYRTGLDFSYVDNVNDVFKIALTDQPAVDAISL